jgi:hypothetical protein
MWSCEQKLFGFSINMNIFAKKLSAVCVKIVTFRKDFRS